MTLPPIGPDLTEDAVREIVRQRIEALEAAHLGIKHECFHHPLVEAALAATKAGVPLRAMTSAERALGKRLLREMKIRLDRVERAAADLREVKGWVERLAIESEGGLVDGHNRYAAIAAEIKAAEEERR